MEKAAVLRDLFSLLPAHAGVIPSRRKICSLSHPTPRTCGGDSLSGQEAECIDDSPRVRGAPFILITQTTAGICSPPPQAKCCPAALLFCIAAGPFFLIFALPRLIPRVLPLFTPRFAARRVCTFDTHTATEAPSGNRPSPAPRRCRTCRTRRSAQTAWGC